MRYWQTKEFWLDSAWRSTRTFCQSLAGLLVAVQSSNQIGSVPEITIPWYGYLYSSGIAALISMLQSIDRERAVNSSEPTAAQPTSPASLTYDQVAAEVNAAYSGVLPPHGCGESLR